MLIAHLGVLAHEPLVERTEGAGLGQDHGMGHEGATLPDAQIDTLADAFALEPWADRDRGRAKSSPPRRRF
ncbi:hypothetical protein [Streptomyces carpinensis]|uniref:hypothetical protein n=1 Tax=Streptomyces carpinensis TaxID=66369 RepID=UPI001302C03B|nr:hypothetical protein [Streptomyces carpinensis]